MTLQFYNTMTGKKEPFVPLTPGKVGVYVCGVTVWDVTHLGHGRAAIVFDVLVRYLRQRGHAVTYVRNYTDVDDKIINRANQEGVAWQAIAEKYIAEYATSMAALGNGVPDVEPKASAHIPEMIATISQLVQRGLAYAAGGDVFYAVRKFSGYGKLSGKQIDELEVGARIDPNEAKRDPLDFALWKGAKPGEPAWESPWGPGRPGWHIECSAMSAKYLGQPFDIHGGGRDLIFPHHENEIAQSEGAGGTEFARYWMHNGVLTIDAAKMSKSLGNYFRTTEALQRYDREVLRYFLLSAHYRSPLDFSVQSIIDGQEAVERFYVAMERLGLAGASEALPPPSACSDEYRNAVNALLELPAVVTAALDDDLNTPRVFGAVFKAVRELNTLLDDNPGTGCIDWLRAAWQYERAKLDAILGIFGSDPAEYRQRADRLAMLTRGVDSTEVERLIAARNAARKGRDFATSDALRKQLTEMGVELKDRPDGTTEWKVKGSA